MRFAHGSDWPQYKKNAARTGDAPDEALELPMTRVMAVRFPSPIYASPAVVGGRVYIQDAHGYIACVDAVASKAVWITELGGINNFSSPAVMNGRVYIGSNDRYLAILDASTGKLLKKVHADAAVITAPAVENGHVYFSTVACTLTKINMDGNVIWTFHDDSKSYTEFAVKGPDIRFTGGNKELRGSRRYEASVDGAVVYKLRDEGDTVRVLFPSDKTPPSSPAEGMPRVPSGGPVFGPDGGYAVNAWEGEDGMLFIYRQGARHSADKDSRQYASRATPSCRGTIYYRGDLAADIYGNHLWQTDPAVLPSNGYHSSPALAANHLVVGTELGRVVFFDIASDREMKVPDGPLPENGRSAPPVPIRKAAWVFETSRAGRSNGAVSSSPAVSGGSVYFGCEDGILYGLGKGSETPIMDALPKEMTGERVLRGSKLKGLEWHSPGGDMGYSFVSPDTTIRPPFRIKWRTRIWDVMKGPVIVAEGKVLVASRLGQLAALDAETGEILWRAHHPGIESRPSCVYADGKMIVLRCGSPEGRGLWCHDAKTGEVVWRRPEVGFGYHRNAHGPVACDGKVFAFWKEKNTTTIIAAAYDLADGKEVWKKTYEGLLSEKDPWPSPGIGQRIAGDGLFFFAVPDRFTAAVYAADGSMAWKSAECLTQVYGMLALRNGILLVFRNNGGHALEAKTGKFLWKFEAPPRQGKFITYMTPLTDRFLDSKGTRNVAWTQTPESCSYTAYANNVWYGHMNQGGIWFEALVEAEDAKNGLALNEVWRHYFTGHACPAPAIAYGRLYYSPNCEGVVYCFEPGEDEPELDHNKGGTP